MILKNDRNTEKELQKMYSSMRKVKEKNKKCPCIFLTKSLRNAEIYGISFTEDIEEILDNLNEHVAAGGNTWNAKFLKLCKSFMAIFF